MGCICSNNVSASDNKDFSEDILKSNTLEGFISSNSEKITNQIVELKTENHPNLLNFFEKKNTSKKTTIDVNCQMKEIPKQSESENKKTKFTKRLSSKFFYDKISWEQEVRVFGIQLLEEFNEARTKPFKYQMKLEGMNKYIKRKKNKPGIKDTTYLFHYPNSDKVKLPTGPAAFQKAMNFLKNLKPLPFLRWNEEIRIDIPYYIEIFDREYLEKLIKDKKVQLKNKYPMFSVNLDIFTHPEVSAILQIVDDNIFHGQRRDLIFNENITEFAVSQGRDKNDKLYTIICFA